MRPNTKMSIAEAKLREWLEVALVVAASMVASGVITYSAIKFFCSLV